jgi:AcrR family transcriptional regulator
MQNDTALSGANYDGAIATETDEVESTGDRLLVLAAELFRERGYGATTTRELSNRLGLKKASLYHHISSKEDLLFEISVESLKRISTVVQAACESVPEEQRLTALVDAHVMTALADRDMHTTMLVEMRALSPDRKAEVLAKRNAYEQYIESVIQVDQLAGRVRSDISPRYLTLSLLNLLNWTIFWYDPDGDFTLPEIVVILRTVFMEGVERRLPAPRTPAFASSQRGPTA